MERQTPKKPIRNPYQFRDPVSGPNFFGRHDLTEDILAQDRPYCWVRGARRGGKTSLLKQLAHICSSDKAYASRFIPFFWSLTGVSDENGMQKRFIQGLKPLYGRLNISMSLDEMLELPLMALLDLLMKAVSGSDSKLLFLCDEISSLLESPSSGGLPKELTQVFSSLFETFHSGWAGVVFADTGAFNHFTKPEFANIPFAYNLAPPRFVLGRLEPPDAIALIRQGDCLPGYKSLVDAYESEIRESADDIPFFLQLICHTLFQEAQKGKDSVSSLKNYLENANLEFDSNTILTNDLAGLLEPEIRLLCDIVTAGKDNKKVKEITDNDSDDTRLAFRSLERMGYISPDKTGSYSVKNFFLNAWYRNQLSDQYLMLKSRDPLGGALIKAASEPVYFRKAGEALPVAVKQVQIENFNGIQKTSIQDIPLDAGWIFLTGENGFGKSSILQAIVAGLYGEKEGSRILISNENRVDPDAPVKIGIEFKDGKETVIHNIGPGQAFQPFTKFAAYGPSRLNLFESSGDNDRIMPAYSMFHSDGLLQDIWQKINTLSKGRKRLEDAVISIFLELLSPYIHKISRSENTILYYEGNVNKTRTYSPVRFNQLASGFRSLVATIGDLLVRFIDAGEDIAAPKTLGGLVIIDEIDLHWHPKMQYLVVEKLSSIFPNIQFIVSTHSVLPILGAPENTIFFKVDRNEDQGIWIERVDINKKNLTPDILLSSPLFDYPMAQLSDGDESGIPTDESYAKWRAQKAVEEELKKMNAEEEKLFRQLKDLR